MHHSSPRRPTAEAVTTASNEREVVTTAEVAVGRAVGTAIDEDVSANAVAVGRAAHGKRASSHGEEVAVRNKQQKTSAPVNVTISTQATDPFSTPTKNNETIPEEVQVCWKRVIGWSILQNSFRK